jgi:hypothetical protein
MREEIRLLALYFFFYTSPGDVKMRSPLCGDVTIGGLEKKSSPYGT